MLLANTDRVQPGPVLGLELSVTSLKDVDTVLVGAACTLTSELPRPGRILSEETSGSVTAVIGLTSLLVRNETGGSAFQ